MTPPLQRDHRSHQSARPVAAKEVGGPDDENSENSEDDEQGSLPNRPPLARVPVARRQVIRHSPQVYPAEIRPAHIGTYALPVTPGRAAHIAGYALPVSVLLVACDRVLLVESVYGEERIDGDRRG